MEDTDEGLGSSAHLERLTSPHRPLLASAMRGHPALSHLSLAPDRCALDPSPPSALAPAHSLPAALPAGAERLERVANIDEKKMNEAKAHRDENISNFHVPRFAVT